MNKELLDALTKATLTLKEHKVEPLFPFEGYNIFVSPAVAKGLDVMADIQKAREQTLIRNVLVNEKKRLVTVVFKDGTHEIIKCSKNDEFDVNVGVALAIAQHLYGSKNKFHKDIQSKVKVI